MEAKGRIQAISKDWQTDKLIISFLVDSVPSDLDDLQTMDLDIVAKPHRKKRSLNANSYFHVLSGKIAEKLGTSLTHEKNRLIREYGQYEVIDGMIPTLTAKAKYEDRLLDMEAVHLKVVERPGETVKMAFLRGSHTYNTAEMSRLIDATVAEAKELNIETLTPDQVERMKASWTKKS
jgi:hypothetical protein